jgi:hypothetical protein
MRVPVMDTTDRTPLEEPDSSRTMLYLSVVLVEAIVILTLWAFSRYFGS